MQHPVRVLIVEHRLADRGIAKRLLAEYDLDFGWQCLENVRELRKVAADFNPDIVLCTDDMSPMSTRSTLEALRLLCAQTPVILISSVRDVDTSLGGVTTSLFLETLRNCGTGAADQSCAGGTMSRYTQEAAHLRRGFSSMLESSADPALMSDANGWITHANVSACRKLEAASVQSLGSLLCPPLDPGPRSFHWLDVARDSNRGNDQYSGPFGMTHRSGAPEQGKHRLAYFDVESGLPTPVHVSDFIGDLSDGANAGRGSLALVAMALHGARISDRTCPQPVAEGKPTAADSEPAAEVAAHGAILRIAQDDFLLVVPDLTCAADAAGTVQRVLDSLEPNREVAAIDSRLPYREPARLHVQRHAQPVAHAHLPLEEELGDALHRHALSLQYQPQYELKTGRGCGVEALARWVLCTGESVAPSVFIPVAERSGMIRELGAWVLQSACEAAVAWGRQAAQASILSVNVSALQIDADFCGVIGRTLKLTGFPAQQLELEITESALIANTELTISYMKEWKRLGVRIAVDDFGTGFSSLSYLSRLPIDRLKLDQSLVQMMTRDSKSAAVMRTIVALGAELDIDVVAEGVETEQQFQMLTALGCPRVQGYLFARPMAAAHAQLALRKTWGNRPKQAPRPMRAAMGECHAV